MNFRINHSWRRRFAAGVSLTIIAALTFLVAAARPDAGNPILGTIKANIISQNATTVTIAVKGEWNWLSHNADCNYDRAATGAGLAWGDRNGADNARTISSINRTNNVVTITVSSAFSATQTPNVGDTIMIANLTGAGAVLNTTTPVVLTSASTTQLKYASTGANIAAGIYGGAGRVEDMDLFNGWEVYKSSTSNGWIGTQFGSTQNPIDREVHPVDRGNIPADGSGPLPGALVSNGAPVNQARFDPGMNATTGLSNDYTKWKGGCGREPVTATPIPITSATENASKVVTLTLGAPGNASFNVGDSITVAGVTNNNYNGNFTVTGKVGANQITYTSGKSNLPASSGGTVTDNTLGPNQSGPGCIEWCTDPWGSWGYDTFDSGSYTLGLTHTYLKQIPDPLHPGQTISGLPQKICVNFYDVHGGGTTAAAFQAVNGTKEVQVDGNGDNSIQTNAFNINEGANCTSAIGSALTTTATNATAPGAIHDTAHLNVPNGSGGTITFTVYGPRALTTTTPDCSGSGTTLAPVSVNGPGDYNSPNFSPTSVGFYDWTAHYSGDPSSSVLAADSGCGAANETSTVTNPQIVTMAGPGFVIGTAGSTISDSATLSGALNPTGKITFNLYGPDDANCSGPAIFTSQATVTGNGSYPSGAYTPTAAGTYRWIANYGGDANNAATSNTCNGPNENVVIAQHDSSIVTHQSFIPQDSVTVTGAFVTPTGNVTFQLFKNDNTCNSTPVFSQTKSLDLTGAATTANSGVNPNGYTAGGNGTWYWKVTYQGDANNQPSSSNCVEKFQIQE